MNDIFISYRRKGGYETAKHLYDLLVRDGYTVSFDIDTLRNGDFDTALLQRIEECTDFILILNKGAFDKTVDPDFNPKNDWMRNELACALQLNKNIIPVMLEGFEEFPDNLPDDICKVVRKNGPKYDNYYFDDFYRKLKKSFFETPEPVLSNQEFKQSNKSVVKFKSNVCCDFYIDGEFNKRVDEDSLTQILLPQGEYFLEFVSAYNAGTDKDSRKIKLQGDDIAFEIDLKSVENKRISMEGKALDAIKNKYKSCNDFHCGLCLASRNGLYGYLNTRLEEVIPFIYEEAEDFQSYYGTAVVKKYGMYGTINLKGKPVIPLEYDKMTGEKYFGPVTEKEYVRCLKGDKCGVLNQLGEIILPFEYESLGDIISDHCIIVSKNKAGLYNLKDRKQVLPVIYDKLILKDNYAVFYIEGHCGLHFYDGSLTTKARYDEILPFSEDLAPVKIGRLWGYIDKYDKLVLSPKFDDCKQFSCGLAAVRKNDKWAYIDHSFKEVIAYKYDEAGPMLAGAAIVKIGDKSGVIDRSAVQVYPMTQFVELRQSILAYEYPDQAFPVLAVFKDAAPELVTPQGNVLRLTDDQYYSYYDSIILTYNGVEHMFENSIDDCPEKLRFQYDSEDILTLATLFGADVNNVTAVYNNDDIFVTVSKIIANYFEKESFTITTETNLYVDLKAGEDDITDLMMQMEEKFAIFIDSESYFRSLETVNEIVEYIRALCDSDCNGESVDNSLVEPKEEEISNEVDPVTQPVQVLSAIEKPNYKIGDIYLHNGVESIIIKYDDSTGEAKLVTKAVKKTSWEDPGFTGISKFLSAKASGMSPETHKDGMKNTRAMKSVKKWNEKYPVIVLCSEYGPDWFLPSIEDFRDGFLNPEIQVHYKKQEGNNIWYWTSNTKLNDNDHAFIINGEICGGSATTASRTHFYPVVAMCYVKLK